MRGVIWGIKEELQDSKKKGFTLMEVLFVLALLMLILGISIPRLNSSVGYTQNQADLANRTLIEGAGELYKLDTGMVPKSIDDLLYPPEGVAGWRGPYLARELFPPMESRDTYEFDEKGKLLP